MKGTQAISVTLLMSFLFLMTRGNYVRNKKQEEDNAQILTYRRVNKTIQMDDGDVYDCIDMNEQPAFDHPLLKDHKIQMKPSSFPIGMDIESLLSDSFSQVQPSIMECPPGTIPILRSGTIAAHNIDGLSNDKHGEIAGIRYRGDVYGARAVLNVYEPKVNKNSKDSSGIWMQMQNGVGEHTDRMAAGLRVFPTFSGDTSVRFHIAWSDGLEKKHCIDFSCPGFVQVNHKIVLGARVRPISVYDGPQRIIGIQIFKDSETRNWWLNYGNITVGYWPNGLFEFLKNKGNLAFWGGFVNGPTASSNSPQMGSGHFASEGYKRAAYIRNIKIIDENDRFFTPDESKVEHGSTDLSKYTVDGFEVSKDVGMRIYYGGPGSYKV